MSPLGRVTRLFVGMFAFAAMVAPAAEAQEDEVVAAIEQMFEGMRTANADMTRAVFAAEGRFAVMGQNGIRTMAPTGWFEGIAGSEGKWDEQIYDVEVKVDGNMAIAWVPYTFYNDGEISHCGINSMMLLHDGEGWKVTQLTDTRRREGCPDPHGG